MQILLTGANVEKNGAGYQVEFNGQVVYQHKLRECCVMIALDIDELIARSTSSNVVQLRVA